jgi:hypothetical protein
MLFVQVIEFDDPAKKLSPPFGLITVILLDEDGAVGSSFEQDIIRTKESMSDIIIIFFEVILVFL